MMSVFKGGGAQKFQFFYIFPVVPRNTKGDFKKLKLIKILPLQLMEL